MTTPLVSVIVPTYNGLKRGYLREALASVLAQTYANFELIIVDDGSDDDIEVGCSDILKDERVRLTRRDNGGLSAARMTGIELAKGEYIALLDDDDRWLPGKLEAQLKFFVNSTDPKTGMVFTGVRLINSNGVAIGVRIKSANGGMYRSFVFHGNGITAPSAVMFRRDVVDSVGNFDPTMRSLEDLDMWLRISRRFSIYSMRELLTDYRLHGDTITAKSFSREEEYERKLYKRILEEDPTLDSYVVERNMLRRFAVRHLSLGNYRDARRGLSESLRCKFSWESMGLFILAIFPPAVLNLMKNYRRQYLLKVLS